MIIPRTTLKDWEPLTPSEAPPWAQPWSSCPCWQRFRWQCSQSWRMRRASPAATCKERRLSMPRTPDSKRWRTISQSSLPRRPIPPARSSATLPVPIPPSWSTRVLVSISHCLWTQPRTLERLPLPMVHFPDCMPASLLTFWLRRPFTQTRERRWVFSAKWITIWFRSFSSACSATKTSNCIHCRQWP